MLEYGFQEGNINVLLGVERRLMGVLHWTELTFADHQVDDRVWVIVPYAQRLANTPY